MARLVRTFAAIGAFVCLAACAGAQAGTIVRSLTCYVVMEEGASSEGNSLFLNKMGMDPELLRAFCPSTFSRGPTGFVARAQGTFAYQADSPVLVDRSGKVVMYEIPVKLKSDPLPKAATTVTVAVDFADLRKAKGLVQPSIKALDYAAEKAGMRSGWAWIVSMKRVSAGKLEAVVGLSK
jgi:hypothetical protein